MTQRKAEVLLAFVIMARATSFVFAKSCLAEMDTFNLLAVRFLLAFALLALLFRGRLRQVKGHTILRGCGLGAAFFIVMSFEVTAIHTTDTAVVSALENTAIILVPLFEAVLVRKRPRLPAIVSAVIAVAGVMLLNFHGGAVTFGKGEIFAMLAACFYACAIILTDRFSHKEEDALVMGVMQVGTLGVLAGAASFAVEAPHLPYAGKTWVMVAVLALVCTGFGFTLQPVAQRHTTAERSGLLCALNPAVAAVLGAVALRERLSLTGLLGIVLILGSLLLPYIVKEKP